MNGHVADASNSSPRVSKLWPTGRIWLLPVFGRQPSFIYGSWVFVGSLAAHRASKFTLGPLQKFSEACCSLSLLCQWGAWVSAATIYPIICWYLEDTQKASESLTKTTVKTCLPAGVSVCPSVFTLRGKHHMLFFSGYIPSPIHYVTNL